MSGVQGIHHAQHHLQAQGGAAAGRIDPRLAGVVRHAVPASRHVTDMTRHVGRSARKTDRIVAPFY